MRRAEAGYMGERGYRSKRRAEGLDLGERGAPE